MYVVKYDEGSWADWGYTDIFITADESKAKAYVEKFNKLLPKLKAHYAKWNDKFRYTEDDSAHRRYYDYIDINGAFYKEVEVR